MLIVHTDNTELTDQNRSLTNKLLMLLVLSSKTKYFFVIKNNFNNSNNIQRPNDLFHEVKKNDVSALVEKVSFLMSSIT